MDLDAFQKEFANFRPILEFIRDNREDLEVMIADFREFRERSGTSGDYAAPKGHGKTDETEQLPEGNALNTTPKRKA